MLTDNVNAPLILIVEDDDSHVDVIRRSFKNSESEYRLRIVGTLREARAAIVRQTPSLVITDFKLPDGEGTDILLAANSRFPVIMMTSQGNEQVAVNTIKAGAQDYIVKSASAFEYLPLTVKYALSTWNFVAARRQADEAVRCAKQDWEQTFDAVPDLISIIDTNHNIIRVNRAMAERCGYTPDEIIGRKCHEVMHGMSDLPGKCPHSRMIQDGCGHSEQIEEKALNGVFDVSVSPLYDALGQIRACVHIARDITERKRVEEERDLMMHVYQLLNKPESLNESMQGITSLLKNWTGYEAVGIRLQDGVDFPYFETSGFPAEFVQKENHLCSYDPSGKVLRDSTGNPVLECMCGNILCGRYNSALPFFTNFGSFWSNNTTALLASTTAAERQAQTRNHCNGEGYESVALIPLRCTGNIFGLLQFNDHRPDCFTPERIELFERVANVLATTISQKKAKEERLKFEQQFQQTQKLESLGVLAGGIAHDFNNILTVILGHCYIVDEDNNIEIGQKEHIKQIEKAANRAADLCRQMLSYAGKNSFVQTSINLWLLVDETVKMLHSAIKKNVVFDLDLRCDVPEIIGDSAQIQQVVMNLIINAAEAIGYKNGTVKVVLVRTIVQSEKGESDFLGNAIPPGSYACMTVSDDGCGMDNETQNRIFEPFYTTKFTGRGLGMSAVLGIIRSHYGALQLSTTLGIGTTFKVYFPLSAVSVATETTPTAGFFSIEKCRGTVLLVDDEEGLRFIGSALLRAMGFSVITAADGREALEIYRERGDGIDIILLDLLMPVMGGIAAYQNLREISTEFPIVICSGYNTDEIMEDINNDEHAAVILKPYKPDQLRSVLVKLLDKME